MRKLVCLGFGNLETIPPWEHLAVSSEPLSMAHYIQHCGTPRCPFISKVPRSDMHNNPTVRGRKLKFLVSVILIFKSKDHRFWLGLERDRVALNKVVIDKATLGSAI
jgi:hypothetical protein